MTTELMNKINANQQLNEAFNMLDGVKLDDAEHKIVIGNRVK